MGVNTGCTPLVIHKMFILITLFGITLSLPVLAGRAEDIQIAYEYKAALNDVRLAMLASWDKQRTAIYKKWSTVIQGLQKEKWAAMDGADAKQQRIIMQAYDEQIRHARTQHAHEEYTARAKVTSDYRKM